MQSSPTESSLRPHLGDFLDIASSLWLTWSQGGEILWAEGGWEDIPISAGSKLVGQSVDSLVHPDDFPAFVDQWVDLAEGLTVDLEVRIGQTGTVPSLTKWVVRRHSINGLLYGVVTPTANHLEGASLVENEAVPAAIATSPSFLYVLDLQNKSILYSNDHISDVLGYSPGQVRSMGPGLFQLAFHPEDLPILRDSLDRIMAAQEGDVVETEVRIRHADGSWRWVWTRDSVYRRDPNGVPTQVVGCAQDVTERRTREDAYRLLFSANPNPMCVFDPGTLRILEVNAAAARHYGFSEIDFVGRKLTDLGEAEDQEAWQSNEVPRFSVWNHYRVNGRPIRVELRAERIEFLGGPAFLAMMRDVTDVVRASAQLRDTEQQLAAVIASAPVAIITLDTEGNVKTWNHWAERIFGRSAEEAFGRPLTGFSVTRTNAAKALIRRILDGETLIAAEALLALRDGERKEVSVSATPLLHEDGERWGTVAVVEDITDRLRFQRELITLNSTLEQRVAERTSDLVASNQELEAFCFSVSHDLRGPLRAIDGFTQAVIQECIDLLTPASLQHLQRVRGASQRMSEVIDALLSLTRLTRAELQREWVDVSAIAEAVAADLLASDTSRTVVFSIEPGMRAFVDPRMMRLLLDNLLGNAWKFTAREHQPFIRFERSEEQFIVEDNGAGFDMNYAARLFQPFERLHPATDFAGHGIGLATVHRILLRHGGDIEAESAVGKGARFRFFLPTGPEENEDFADIA